MSEATALPTEPQLGHYLNAPKHTKPKLCFLLNQQMIEFELI